MKAQSALSFQRSSARPLSNHGAAGTRSSPLEDKYPKSPDPQQVITGREFMPHNFTALPPVSSTSGAIGHIFSSSSGTSSNLHYSSVITHENPSEKAPVLQSTASSQYMKENNNNSWCTDSLTDFLDYPQNAPIQSSNLELNQSAIIMPSEDLGKQNDWQNWADQLITEDDVMTPDWNEILIDTNIADPEPKVC